MTDLAGQRLPVPRTTTTVARRRGDRRAANESAKRSAGQSVEHPAGGERTRSTVTLLARLKLAIVFSGFKGERKRAVGATLAMAFSGIGGIAGFFAFFNSASGNGAQAGRTLVIGFTLLFCAWVFGPLLMGGVDDSLDPRAISLLPIPRTQLRAGLLVAALIGFVPAGTVIALSGVVVGYAPAGPGAIIVVLAALTLLLLALGGARLLAVALAHAIRSRRGRDFALVIASTMGAVLWLGTQATRRLNDEQRAVVVRILRWTPPGALGQAVADARDGALVSPTLRLLAVAIVGVLLIVAWTGGVERLLVQPESVQGGSVSGDGGTLSRIARGRRSAVIARELRYISRSPQRRSTLVVSTVMGTLFALFQVVRSANPHTAAVFAGPAAALFGLGITNNLIGADGKSLWLELLSGASLKDLFVGRGLGAVPYLVLPQVSATTALAVLSGGWIEWLLVMGIALGCWGLPLGVGTVISAVAPFPQPEVFNPFSNRRVAPGEGCMIAVAGVFGLVAVALLALPIAIVLYGTISSDLPLRVAAVAASAMYSMLIWWAGIGIACAKTRGRETDLLEELGAHQANT